MSVLANTALVRQRAPAQDGILAAAVVVVPLLTMLLFATVPVLAAHFEDHWFHFEIVSLCLPGRACAGRYDSHLA